ncbi:MAG: SH3 domain-containing protein [Clostridia bacterium]|nr:SH3 domain-containing protein [Clostridia bacterium]
MRRILLLMTAWMLLACGGLAEEIHWAETAREDLLAEPRLEGSTLNMAKPFEPIELRPEDFDRTDTAFLQRLGLDEDLIWDVTGCGQSEWTGMDGDGRQITVLFCGCYGEEGFVFVKELDGTQRLVDVILCSANVPDTAQIVELAHGRYLLTNGYGHGGGTARYWSNWYNLDTRRMELFVLRSGWESVYSVTASQRTRTNVDHALDLSPSDAPEYLITYAYVSVENCDGHEHEILRDECVARVYRSTIDGLQLLGERSFDAYAPALVENMSVEELLDAETSVKKEGEAPGAAGLTVIAPEEGELAGLLARQLPRATVTHADWVNLREEADKQSNSISRIDMGDAVYVLGEGYGTDRGWTHVLWMPQGASPRIGYIWWSFLDKEQE